MRTFFTLENRSNRVHRLSLYHEFMVVILDNPIAGLASMAGEGAFHSEAFAGSQRGVLIKTIGAALWIGGASGSLHRQLYKRNLNMYNNARSASGYYHNKATNNLRKVINSGDSKTQKISSFFC